MRTTVEFDDDTAAAVEALRRDQGLGLSEAVNELIRRSMLPRPPGEPFRQQTRRLGVRIDVSNVAEALETLEGPQAR
ncbi:MAG: ribbon-helix-helix protein, CopG family [Actinobacteria bacterium]|nr:ribbon-helix-helix protein, CopG family [Actinomycetota bacterium]